MLYTRLLRGRKGGKEREGGRGRVEREEKKEGGSEGGGGGGGERRKCRRKKQKGREGECEKGERKGGREGGVQHNIRRGMTAIPQLPRTV